MPTAFASLAVPLWIPRLRLRYTLPASTAADAPASRSRGRGGTPTCTARGMPPVITSSVSVEGQGTVLLAME